ncbi:MAG: RNA polymerase factor sigma-32 [Pseudomonadota bacterium]
MALSKIKKPVPLEDMPEEVEVVAENENQEAVEAVPEAPAVYDPLRRYLYEIGKHELLTREDETVLAVKYKEEDDQEAAYRLITSNLRLVVKIAMEFQHNWMKNLLDLIQEGNVGLMQALKKFDPYRGVKFSYYASFWIKAYILKFIMDNWHLVRVGTTQAQRKLFYNLKKEKNRLLAQGLEPGPKLLAESLEVTEKDIIEMDQRLDGYELSLNAPVKDGSDDSHLNFLASGEKAVDDLLADREIKRLLNQKLGEFRHTLNERELHILDRRILTEAPQTLQEMGAEFGISRERVRQIEDRIKKNIREYLAAELPELSPEDYLSRSGEGN